VEGTLCRGLLRHTLANGALVHSSQRGKYRSGPRVVIAVSYAIPKGKQAFPPCVAPFDGDQKFSLHLEGGLLKWEL
jgi:hypothetical protein